MRSTGRWPARTVADCPPSTVTLPDGLATFIFPSITVMVAVWSLSFTWMWYSVPPLVALTYGVSMVKGRGKRLMKNALPLISSSSVELWGTTAENFTTVF